MNVVGIIGWFQETHPQALKRIFKYLQGTQDFGLWCPKNADFALHAYTNEDWASNIYDHKSTSGGAFLLGPHLVSWFNKKEISIALSTTEEEYVATTSWCTQILWMIQTLKDIKVTYPQTVPILWDNSSVISIFSI